VPETVFSSIKRTFGEHVTARKFHNMVKEILLKAALYNMFNRDQEGNHPRSSQKRRLNLHNKRPAVIMLEKGTASNKTPWRVR